MPLPWRVPHQKLRMCMHCRYEPHTSGPADRLGQPPLIDGPKTRLRPRLQAAHRSEELCQHHGILHDASDPRSVTQGLPDQRRSVAPRLASRLTYLVLVQHVDPDHVQHVPRRPLRPQPRRVLGPRPEVRRSVHVAGDEGAPPRDRPQQGQSLRAPFHARDTRTRVLRLPRPVHRWGGGGCVRLGSARGAFARCARGGGDSSIRRRFTVAAGRCRGPVVGIVSVRMALESVAWRMKCAGRTFGLAEARSRSPGRKRGDRPSVGAATSDELR